MCLFRHGGSAHPAICRFGEPSSGTAQDGGESLQPAGQVISQPAGHAAAATVAGRGAAPA